VREGSFVGVVAQTEWAAIQAAKALKVTWAEPAKKLQTPEEVDEYLKTAKSSRDLKAVDKGNVEVALAQSGKKFEAAYHWPFQMHGMMGPSCAVADVRGDKVTVWTGAQGPFTTRDRIAAMLRLPKRNVSVIFAESSGCYGRRRRRGCRPAFARGCEARARAMDARGRTHVVTEGATAAYDGARRRE